MEEVESLVLDMLRLRFLVEFQMETYSRQLDTCVWSEEQRLYLDNQSEESPAQGSYLVMSLDKTVYVICIGEKQLGTPKFRGQRNEEKAAKTLRNNGH